MGSAPYRAALRGLLAATAVLAVVSPCIGAAQPAEHSPAPKTEADERVLNDERAADAEDDDDEAAVAPTAADMEPAPESPEVAPSDVTDAGVPNAPVEPEKALEEVERSVQKVEQVVQEAEKSPQEGIPHRYTIEFGDTFDWLRLSSGEWIKGEFHWMRDQEFEFDSVDLGIVTEGWEKMTRLHAPRVHTYAFVDGTDLIGRAVITPDKIIVETADGVVSMPRDEILGVVDGGRRERDFWYMSLGAGFSGTMGNSSQGSLNGDFELGRADHRSVAELTYDGTVSYADREETANRHIGTVDFRIYITQRYYVAPITGEFFNDRFANIRLRANPAVAGGLHVFDTANVEWDFELSEGYQYLRFRSTVDGLPDPQNDFFIGFKNTWSFDLGSVFDLDLSWQTALVVTTIGNTNHQGSAVFGVDVTEIFDLDVTFNFYRVEEPGPRSDGTVPQKNDYQVVVGVTLEFGY